MSTCQEKAGFLFNHVCGEPAVLNCEVCGKAVCLKHSRRINNQSICIACAKKMQARAQRSGQRLDGLGDDDPYFYSSYYYRDYGYYGRGAWGHDTYDDADFSEADGMALGGDDDVDWETDMGAS